MPRKDKDRGRIAEIIKWIVKWEYYIVFWELTIEAIFILWLIDEYIWEPNIVEFG